MPEKEFKPTKKEVKVTPKEKKEDKPEPKIPSNAVTTGQPKIGRV